MGAFKTNEKNLMQCTPISCRKNLSKSTDVSHSELPLKEYQAKNDLDATVEINRLTLSAGQGCFSSNYIFFGNICCVKKSCMKKYGLYFQFRSLLTGQKMATNYT